MLRGVLTSSFPGSGPRGEWGFPEPQGALRLLRRPGNRAPLCQIAGDTRDALGRPGVRGRAMFHVCHVPSGHCSQQAWGPG